jgi:serine/threonine protein kinase
MSPEFVLIKRKTVSIWIHRKLSCEPIVGLLADADGLLAQTSCAIVKDQRKITVGRIAIEYGGSNHGVYLKRYNAYSWRRQIFSFFTKSAALRALRGAAVLKHAGIQTAPPIAVVEFRHRGLLTKSYYVSEEITGGKTADAYWRDDLAPLSGVGARDRRRQFLKRLAVLFGTLHCRHVYHNDLKDANILVVRSNEQEQFYLLDLEGVHRQVNRRRRLKNLVQLHRTLGRYLKQTEQLYFLQNYLSAAGFSKPEHRYWSSRILRESRALDRRKVESGHRFISACG